MSLAKAMRLLSLLPRRPGEFVDRVANVLQERFERLSVKAPTYQTTQWKDLVVGLEGCLSVNLNGVIVESALHSIEAHVRAEIEKLRLHAPFRLSHNADFSLARVCYGLCRAMNPAVVLETGVGYGVTSAFVLQALEQNQKGQLHSIDLPPLGSDVDRFTGILIPELLKKRWRLHRGASKRVMPQLLSQFAAVDIFIHDSLHTYRNISRELQMVAPRLAPRCIVIADDIEGNSAFLEWVGHANPAFWATMKEEAKDNQFGVSVHIDGSASRSSLRSEAQPQDGGGHEPEIAGRMR